MGKVAVSPFSSPRTKDVEAGAGRRAPYPLPESWVSWMIPSFVAANVVAFGYSIYFNDCLGTPHQSGEECLFPSLGRFALEPISVNPLLGPSVGTLDALGALDYEKVVVDKEWWRLFTCIWLHGGIIHLVVNMLSLLFIGVRLEQEFGFVKIGTLYVLSGFGGSLASSLSIRSKISVGASGALFGLLGAMLSELITNWTIYANKCAALLALIIVIVINLAVGMVPHVDSSAHIGGFVCGFLLGFILLIRPQFGYVNRKYIPTGYDMDNLKPRHKVYQYLLWTTALILLIIGYMTGLAKLFNGEHLNY